MVLQLLCDHRYVFIRQLVAYKLRHIGHLSVAKFTVFTREMVKETYMVCFGPLEICIKVLFVILGRAQKY